jgi:hypothetical protein
MSNAKAPKSYVERVGFTPSFTAAIVFLLGLTGFWVWMGTDPVFREDLAGWAFIVLPILFFGGFGLILLVDALRRPITVRVDHEGVTLGRPPGLLTQHGLRWRTPTVRVLWRDIEAIVLFSQHSNASSGAIPTFIGLGLRAGASLPPAEPVREGMMRRLSVLMGQDRAPADVSLYRHIFGWRVDVKRLGAVVRRHAPAVKVMDRR